MSDVATPQSPPAGDDAPSAASSGRRVAPIVVGAVAVLLAGLFALLLLADPDENAAADSPLLGRPAPDVEAVYADDSAFTLSHRKSSWVVLNFFTHDCVPCIREHPELIEFVDQQRALGADGAEFYSVVRDSTREQVDEFFAERGGDWPVVYDDEYEFVNGFGVALVPETWIIDPNGIVRSRFIAEVEADPLSALIQSMREEMS